jgi:2-methylisocitrate lyase-like PEP mutase family enzyme
MSQAKQLRRLVEAGNTVVAPGVYDGLSARLVARAGFPAMYASGGAIARSTGIPDLGLMSPSEIVTRLEQIVDAVDIPVIADADTGYGNALTARKAAREFERAGVAGFHIEDQTFPKKCGHYENKSVVPVHEFQQTLRAVRDSLQNSDTIIIARTDAIAVEGFEAAIARAHAYAEAGADMVFIEAPVSREQIEKTVELLPYPKLINMFAGGKTPLMSIEELTRLGYALVIIPSDLQRSAIKAMQRTLEAIKLDGSSVNRADDMVTFDEREAIIGTEEYDRLSVAFGV